MANIGGLLSKIYKKLPSLIFDVSAIPVAWYFAFWLRYNLQPFPHHLTSIYSIAALLLLMVIQVSCYYYCKVYRGLWRFTSINDVIRIIKATLLAIVLVIPAFYVTSLLQHVPRSILPMYALGLVTLLCGGRLTMRMYRDRKGREDMSLEMKRILIIGAGHAGEGLLRDLKK